MKMVKSLLLGSAAGLVAVSAGQAADLPVKAKPVEYVKVCSLYGAGFYYMPGTDICLKIGGYVRSETTFYQANGNFTQGPSSANVENRSSSNFVMRARAYITADAREQTAFGTARAYVAVGVATTDTGAAIVVSPLGFNRAFIQWAGITTGITQSFYDFYSAAATGFRAYLPSSDTGDPGWWVWAYTAQLGNGMSATLSAEQRRTSQILNVTTASSGTAQGLATITAPFTNGTINGLLVNTAGYGGLNAPDVVANFRVDQTWGSAQIMGAAHEVDPNYFGNAPITGHPTDEWGWVAGAGLRLNFPMIAQGDYFQSQVNYTHGGMRYLSFGNSSPNWQIENGNTYGFGVMSDCVFASLHPGTSSTAAANGTGCELTTGWGVNAAYEHYWTPQFHESFVGGYLRVNYDTLANANLCAAETFLGAPATSITGAGAVAPAGCNNNFTVWTAATRFQYDVTKSLYLGVEVLYQRLDSASLPGNTLVNPTQTAVVAPPGNGLLPGNQIKDQDFWAFTLRMHKDFLP